MILSLLAGTLFGSRPLVLAHYMPWYESKPFSGKWGWHWTMNHFDPETLVPGHREIASKHYPLIGPYDSNDPDALECQVLLMKMSGIDGAVIDWYGTDDVYDYAAIHRNTLQFIKTLKRAGLKFSICYEDQTLPNIIKLGKVTEADVVPYAQKLMAWMNTNWFKDPSYVKQDGKPLLMVFGPAYYKAPQWQSILKGFDLNIYGVNGQYDFATGGFAWPYPKEGLVQTENFYKWSKGWKGFVAGAYPRFQDIYGEAKVRPQYDVIPDDGGKTFEKTFDMAVASKASVIQIATWNDWGEGTEIEPSQEFGYRGLEALQKWRNTKLSDPILYKPSDLRLPVDIYMARKKRAKPGQKVALDAATEALFAGKPENARKLLKDLG